MVQEFNVTLTREELKALSVFKPELKQTIDDADNFYNEYVNKSDALLGFLNFLSHHNFKEHLSKLTILANNVKYFTYRIHQDKILEYKLLEDPDNFYRELYKLQIYASNIRGYVDDYSDEEVREMCSNSYDIIKKCMKD